MNCPVCIRALVLLPLILFGAAGGVRAEQSDPAAAKQTDPTSAPPTTSNGQPVVVRKTGKLARNAIPPQNPAEAKYGLPQNPLTNGPVDTDLSKPLTLYHAIQLGLAFQNAIAISQSQVDQASARLVQARSSYYPQLVPSYSYVQSLTPTPIFTTDPVTHMPTRSYQSISTTTQASALSVTQLLYDMGQREANVGASRRSLFAAEYGLGDQRQNVVLQVAQDYYNLLRDRELINEDVKSVARYQETLDIVTKQAEVGVAAQSDVYQPKADLANAKVQLLQDQSNYQVAEETLKNAMGVVSPNPLVLPQNGLPQPNPTPDPNGLEKYVQLAYSNRLDIKQQQEIVYSQGYEVKLAKIQNGITVDASITEGYAVQPISGEERSISVSVSYPLFDGGNTRAAVHLNQALWEQQKRTLDQLEQNVRLDVANSYQVRELARQRVVAAQVAFDAGQENLNVVRAKEQNQLAALPDIIDAERQLDTAGISLVQAIYDYYVADAALQRNIGVNDPVYVPKVPGAKPPIPGPKVP